MISTGSFQPQLFCVFYFMLRQLSGQASLVETKQNKEAVRKKESWIKRDFFGCVLGILYLAGKHDFWLVILYQAAVFHQVIVSGSIKDE